MEKKNIVDSLVGIIKETEEQDKMLQSQNAGWRKELRERFDWTQNTTIKGKVELEKFIQELLDKAREEGKREGIEEGTFTKEELQRIRHLFMYGSAETTVGDVELQYNIREKIDRLLGYLP